MNTYKIVAGARIVLYQYIKANSEAEAIKQWEDSDCSMDEIDEDSIEGVEYSHIVLIAGQEPDIEQPPYIDPNHLRLAI